MLLRPSAIHFSQDSVSKYFDRRSRHSTQTIGQTLDQIIIGKCEVGDIPKISVIKIRGHGDKWFSVDNRRLWVFRQLERLGYLDTIEVISTGFNYYHHSRKFTTLNGGISIRIRGDGDPGGMGHSLPDKYYHAIKKIQKKEQSKEGQGHRTDTATYVGTKSQQKPRYQYQDEKSPVTPYVKISPNVDHNESRKSLQPFYGNSYASTQYTPYVGYSTSSQTSKTQTMTMMSRYSATNNIPKDYHDIYHYSKAREECLDNAGHLSAKHLLFQPQDRITFPEKRSETREKNDHAFSESFKELSVSGPQDAFYSGETTKGISKPKEAYQTDSSFKTTFKEHGAVRITSDNYAREISKANIYSRISDRKACARSNTAPTTTEPIKSNSKYIGERTFSPLEEKESSINQDHQLKTKQHKYGDLFYSLGEASTNYKRPDLVPPFSRSITELKRTVKTDQNGRLSGQFVSKYGPGCTEEEIKSNMANLLYRQRYRFLRSSAWNIEAVYDSLSSDESL